MMNTILQNLLEKQQISPSQAENIQEYEDKKPFSLNWELTTMLSIGVLMLNLGLGILLYQNIDSIGHGVLIALIGLVSVACFYYAFRYRSPFSFGEVTSPTPYFDYVLLFGCLTFLLMEGYWQYQYQIFGEQYGLATFIPMVFFFAVAYFFDHKGVLSLAITTLAAWVGLTITPLELLQKNDFNSAQIIYTGVFLGASLVVASFVLSKLNPVVVATSLNDRKSPNQPINQSPNELINQLTNQPMNQSPNQPITGIKSHFSSVYHHFGIHIYMVACLAGMIAINEAWLFFPLLVLGTVYFIKYARKTDSLFFMTSAIVYAYIGVTYLILTNVKIDYFGFHLIYFMFSCAGIIAFFLNHKELLKSKQR
jgi:Predicted membrane protein (DUF2157)/L-rhamnose-proton symport protein (RhaT)